SAGRARKRPGIQRDPRGMDSELHRVSGERTTMLQTANTTPLQTRAETPESPDTTQKVVIVNGSTEMLELLETVLDAGHYDVVFVESSEHAYSQIKRVLPDLVILCIKVGGMDGFQVLSMLKLDEQTR